LNPGFRQLDFGRVEEVRWRGTNGVEVTGGLYLPPDYDPAKRYPLVIQTHGFERARFSMDGLDEWSSGFAARPLAARGIIVLQAIEWGRSYADVSSGKYGGANPSQAFKMAASSVFEGAIDYLDARGMIDRSRVGISGFSRAVCFVAYTLTHTKYSFAAGVLTDGIDCGYFNYLCFPHEAWDGNALNGGLAPFGEGGLKEWLNEAPGFNLDHVHMPMRLVALNPGSVLESWEWFVGLTLQKSPVDFIEIPDASHLMQKPWDRRISLQGLVDWFCFWLKGEEDSDPQKAGQYTRWRRLANAN
jgi:hypothetical protein